MAVARIARHLNRGIFHWTISRSSVRVCVCVCVWESFIMRKIAINFRWEMINKSPVFAMTKT